MCPHKRTLKLLPVLSKRRRRWRRGLRGPSRSARSQRHAQTVQPHPGRLLLQQTERNDTAQAFED